MRVKRSFACVFVCEGLSGAEKLAAVAPFGLLSCLLHISVIFGSNIGFAMGIWAT